MEQIRRIVKNLDKIATYSAATKRLGKAFKGGGTLIV